jgi:hypothetical protein
VSSPELREVPFVHLSDLSVDLQSSLKTDTTIQNVLTLFEEKGSDTRLYFVGLGNYQETIVGRIVVGPDGEYSNPQLVRMPGSELKERRPVELVLDCVEDAAWD